MPAKQGIPEKDRFLSQKANLMASNEAVKLKPQDLFPI